MSPTLESGDAVLINPKSKVEVGDIVLADHPFKKSVRMLKRIGEVTADNKFVLFGDNADESSDSRGFGAISKECILGKATCRLK